MDHQPLNELLQSQPVADVLPDMRNSSEVVILDFHQIPASLPEFKNIQMFFEKETAINANPKLPEQRQKFNDTFLQQANKKYLIGRYGEDRIEMLRGSQIAKEGRTIHLGIDLFTQETEEVYAPYDGTVVTVGQEPEDHSYGYYAILEHQINTHLFYTFYGHLSSTLPESGRHIAAGQSFVRLGDFTHHENGGWSRHLHFQLIFSLPPDHKAPQGYATPEAFTTRNAEFPDPNLVLHLAFT